MTTDCSVFLDGTHLIDDMALIGVNPMSQARVDFGRERASRLPVKINCVKYKNIASALHNFGDSFTSDSNVVARDTTMADLARRAIRGLSIHLRFDLLKGTCEPPYMVSPPIDESIGAYTAWFPKLLRSQNVEPSVIVNVFLDLEFQTARVSSSTGFPNSSEMPVDCTIVAADDCGQEHVVRFRRWLTFYDTDPDQQHRSPHAAMR